MGGRFIAGETGASAIEYALIAALIAVSCLVAFNVMGSSVDRTMANASAPMNDGISPTQQPGASKY